jgi:uncharacterized membrane protein
MPLNHIQEHIDLIAKHEQEFLARRTHTERLGDAIAGFAGSLTFVALHLAIFIGWITINTLPIPHLQHFDPAPYALLGTFLAFEAILLASFILMRQSRTGRRANERENLMIQILLLTERETTAVLDINRQIAEKAGLKKIAADKDIQELSQQTSIDDVAQTIYESQQPE